MELLLSERSGCTLRYISGEKNRENINFVKELFLK